MFQIPLKFVALCFSNPRKGTHHFVKDKQCREINTQTVAVMVQVREAGIDIQCQDRRSHILVTQSRAWGYTGCYSGSPAILLKGLGVLLALFFPGDFISGMRFLCFL